MWKRISGSPPARAGDGGGLYGADLARIHHDHFAKLADAAATELLGRPGARAVESGTIVDLAAGSGILGRRALDAGFDVVGVDILAALERAGYAAERLDRYAGGEPLPGWSVFVATNEAG